MASFDKNSLRDWENGNYSRHYVAKRYGFILGHPGPMTGAELKMKETVRE